MMTKGILDQVCAALGGQCDFARADVSFSPFYSDLGLGFNDAVPGIAQLFLHYNRRTTSLGAPFLKLDDALIGSERTPVSVRQVFASGQAEYAFCGHNTWLARVRCPRIVEFSFGAPEMIELRVTEIANQRIFDGYLSNQDKRDPDVAFPFVLGLRVLKGRLSGSGAMGHPLRFSPDAQGELLICFSASCLEVGHERLEQRLAEAPVDFAEAVARSRRWLTQALGNLDFSRAQPRERAVLAKAACALAFNACRAPGLLGGRVSLFPNRGRYPTHYMWDSCFQNLALEHMDPQLAPDSLLLLTENQRVDGKLGHFLCSTWMRPHESQPALVGWAALRLVEQRSDLNFARRILPALLKNNRWWLQQRMTRFGLISSPGPLETGWDDTPRQDQGAILALDMNTYVLLQMRACAVLARRLGDENTAADCERQSRDFGRRLVDVFYDPADNLFKDVMLSTGERLPLKTPACFIPLLADLPLPPERIRAMIENSLLDPRHFFGAVPFPSVAYDEVVYEAETWWRGPTWIPIAYLMLEVLRRHGFDQPARIAAKRLYDMLIADGNLRELFNSRTGEGMGAYEQGWTAAICLRLYIELNA
ncbi:MAG: trehalase family glycosidase [Planctomycetota bacterium]